VPTAVTTTVTPYALAIFPADWNRYSYARKLIFCGKKEYPYRVRVASSVMEAVISRINGKRQQSVRITRIKFAKNRKKRFVPAILPPP